MFTLTHYIRQIETQLTTKLGTQVRVQATAFNAESISVFIGVPYPVIEYAVTITGEATCLEQFATYLNADG